MEDTRVNTLAAADQRKKVILLEPRGFCAGVRRAIAIVEQALAHFGPPVYVRKEIVHNEHVVRELTERGARFVDSEQQVPHGAVCVFSAHGVSPQVRQNAARRELRVIDATCPLVAKVHREAVQSAQDGRTILLVGHRDHEEVEGVHGEVPDRTWVVESVDEARRIALDPAAPVTYLTQTTLSLDETADVVEALRERFGDLRGPRGDDICYASQNRQNGIKAVASRCELVLVVGSANSSNSNRMVDVARVAGTRAHLVSDPAGLDVSWLDGVRTVAVSSGASAPEHLVDELLDRLAALGFRDVQVDRTATEDIAFSVPPPNAGPA